MFRRGAFQPNAWFEIGNYGIFGETGLHHFAALEIIESGTTHLTYHPMGYSYMIAFFYALLPKSWNYYLVSISVIQILSLPVLVWCAGRLAEDWGRKELKPWAMMFCALYLPIANYASVPTTVFPPLVLLSVIVVLIQPAFTSGKLGLTRLLIIGVLLGAATSIRPQVGLLGPVIGLTLWLVHKKFWLAFRLTLPIGLASLFIFGSMIVANKSKSEALLPGGQGAGYSLLIGSYQFERAWFPWKPAHYPNNPDSKPIWDHVERLEQETGFPRSHPLMAGRMAEAAWQRYRDPARAFRKIALSILSIHIITPQFNRNVIFKRAVVGLEFILLALALIGGWLVKRRHRFWPWVFGIMLITPMTFMFLHIEPRYSLPFRMFELILAAIALDVICRWIIRRFNFAKAEI